MISRWLYRWCSLAFWLRTLLIAAAVGLAALTFWQGWQRPLQQKIVQLSGQQRQEAKRYRLLTEQFIKSASLTQTEAEIARLQQALRPTAQQPFSLLSLTKAAGGNLQSWQPNAQGGELTLALSWEQAQALFRYLSEQQAAIDFPLFSLKRVNEQLLLKMVLRYDG